MFNNNNQLRTKSNVLFLGDAYPFAGSEFVHLHVLECLALSFCLYYLFLFSYPC